MKTKFLCSALLVSLFTTAEYAAPSVEELKVQVAAKREELILLCKEKLEFERALPELENKIAELKEEFNAIKRLQLLGENSDATMNEKDLEKAFFDECQRLTTEYLNTQNKNKYIAHANVSSLYMIKYILDMYLRARLCSAVKKVSHEIVMLNIQIHDSMPEL